MKKLHTVIIVLLIFALYGCVTQPAMGGPVPLTLVYTGNLDGELEPCGCSEGGNKGGIKRQVQKIDELRQQDKDLVLISTGGLLVSEMPQDRLKSVYILKGLEQMNYDVFGVQWPDLAYGPEFLNQFNMSWVVSNWQKKYFVPEKQIKRNGVNLHYFQWLDPSANPAGTMAGDDAPDKKPNLLNQRLKQVKAVKGITIVATTLPLADAKSLLDLSNIDILLIKAKYEVYGEPLVDGKTLVLQPGSRGMRMASALLKIESGVVSLEGHEVFPLPPEVKDAPRMLGWYDEYNAEVKKAYQQRVELRKKLMSGESPYAGEKVCKTCHQKQYDIWFDTRHAEAFYALQDVGKGFDPDCIACHVVGFDKPGGFVDAQITSRLQHVQCENCHGAAKKHADSGGQVKPENHAWQPQEMCQQCHVQKHSPDFKFANYWPKIKH